MLLHSSNRCWSCSCRGEHQKADITIVPFVCLFGGNLVEKEGASMDKATADRILREFRAGPCSELVHPFYPSSCSIGYWLIFQDGFMFAVRYFPMFLIAAFSQKVSVCSTNSATDEIWM
jgi:hypothetical protein